MSNTPFAPQGATVLIGTAAAQAQTTAGFASPSHRVRCVVAAYLTWGQTNSVTAVGGPGVNTIGMAAGQTEVLSFPSNSWFISNVAASFELTPGDGV